MTPLSVLAGLVGKMSMLLLAGFEGTVPVRIPGQVTGLGQDTGRDPGLVSV